jgi:DNA-binding XRE family transcriptional regulator
METSVKVKLTSGENPLKQIRLALGLTQCEFAESLGTYQKTIVRWEKGQTAPKFSLKQIKALEREMAKLGLRFQDLPDEFDN